MKTLLTGILLCLLIAMPTATLKADTNYSVGYVNSDGYTWNGTHWAWSDGSTWSRTYVQPYYSHGCYYPGYYNYSRVYAPATVSVEKVDEFGVLAKAIAARSAVESKVKLNQQFIEAAQKLGFVNGYPGIVQGGSALCGTFGVNTSTVYGYNQSLSQITNPFAPNLDQYFLNAFQLGQGAQDAAKDANSQFLSAVNNAANRAADLNGINARVAALERLGKLVDGPPVSINTQTQFKLENGKATPAELIPAPKLASISPDLQTRWVNSASRCVACHSGGKTDGGFDVGKFPSMPSEKQTNVIARLLLPKSDPKHMPKGVDPLPPAEIKAWVEMLSLPADRK